jgi:hypothetical protein
MKLNERGYIVLELESGYTVLEHIAVYRSHFPNYDKRYHIHHIDHNKLNNSISNLIALPRMLHFHVHHEAKRRKQPLNRQEVINMWLSGVKHYGPIRTDKETAERTAKRAVKKANKRLAIPTQKAKSYHCYFCF